MMECRSSGSLSGKPGREPRNPATRKGTRRHLRHPTSHPKFFCLIPIVHKYLVSACWQAETDPTFEMGGVKFGGLAAIAARDQKESSAKLEDPKIDRYYQASF